MSVSLRALFFAAYGDQTVGQVKANVDQRRQLIDFAIAGGVEHSPAHQLHDLAHGAVGGAGHQPVEHPDRGTGQQHARAEGRRPERAITHPASSHRLPP